MFHIDKYFLY